MKPIRRSFIAGATLIGILGLVQIRRQTRKTLRREMPETDEARDLAKAFVHMLRAVDKRALLHKPRAALIEDLCKTPKLTPNIMRLLRMCQDPSDWEQLEADIATEFGLDPSLAGRLWDRVDWPRPFWLVLRDELKQIASRRCEGTEEAKAVDLAKNLYSFVAEKKLVGLAFSGGGIRSATFNLGVLQGLAENGILPQIDILSTVSGGGYIGAFFASWMQRHNMSPADLQRCLSPKASPFPDDSTQKPIRFLRQFSNYLTPTLGTFSFDTWTATAIYLRNVLLNQIILFASFGALLIVPRLGGFLSNLQSQSHNVVDGAWIGLAAFLFVLSVSVVAGNLRLAINAGKSARQGNLPSTIQFACILPLLLAVLLSSQLFWKHSKDTWLSGGIAQPTFFVSSMLFFCALSLIISIGGGFWGCFRNRLAGNKIGQLLPVLGLITIVTALVGTSLLRGYVVLMEVFERQAERGLWDAIIWGPPALLSVIALTALLQVGLMGVDFPDAGREWLSRLRAITNLYTFFWLALFGAAIYGPLLVAKLGYWVAGLGTAWIGTTAASVLAGKSAHSGQSKEGAPTISRLDLLAKIGPPVFLVGFVLIVSYFVHLFLAHSALQGDYSFKHQADLYWTVLNHPIKSPRALVNGGEWLIAAPLTLFAGSLFVALLLSWRVDINEFSMHHFYKNRLVRCYLGASNQNRKPNSFIGFDDNDEIQITHLRNTNGYQGPYHIVNATLNLSRGGQLAWQERQAASFIFSPCYSGFNLSPDSDHPGDERGHGSLRSCAYRRTEKYAYKDGVGLGTAIAISGAAADPNQGFNTSAAVAFLMTVFDVRLGWWMGNPRRDAESKLSSPRLGFAALISSLLGWSDDRSRFVSLSDGGHFDNLGLYELVRRRCMYIVLCDAEQDGEYTFGGLGMAVRKCRVDFGAEIDIDPSRIIPVDVMKPSSAKARSNVHCAVGTIRYADGVEGVIVYIKSSLTGDEPEDVLQYAAGKPAFPHESTGQQWFTESQFESYRKLGYHAASSTLDPVKKWSKWNPESKDIADLFKSLGQHWYPPNPAIAAHGATHTSTLNELFDKIRVEEGLHYLGSALFPGGNFSTSPRDSASEYFFCMTLLQLVEDIYVDFGLESTKWFNDPRISGWRTVFETWRRVPSLRQTWNANRDTFRGDFQRFWDDLDERLALTDGNSLVEAVGNYPDNTRQAKKFADGLRIVDRPG